MEFKIPLLFLFSIISTLVSTSQALKFFIGGKDGWTLNPSENYNQWAGRNRFQISDTIVFKYKKGSDSVLEVKKVDYEKCNKTNPIKKFEDGDTEFTLDRAGPFYFISGKDQNCENGQKLTLVVISPRKSSSSPPSPSPSGGGLSPPSPSPKSSPPSGSPPAIPPSTTTPSPSVSPPSPVAIPPASSPVPAGGPMASSPVVSTPPAGAPTASSPSPAGGPPAPSPTISPSTTPAGGPPAPGPGAAPLAPGGVANPPGSSNSAAPSGNSGSSVAPSSFLVYSVTVVVVGALFLRY